MVVVCEAESTLESTARLVRRTNACMTRRLERESLVVANKAHVTRKQRAARGAHAHVSAVLHHTMIAKLLFAALEVRSTSFLLDGQTACQLAKQAQTALQHKVCT